MGWAGALVAVAAGLLAAAGIYVLVIAGSVVDWWYDDRMPWE